MDPKYVAEIIFQAHGLSQNRQIITWAVRMSFNSMLKYDEIWSQSVEETNELF